MRTSTLWRCALLTHVFAQFSGSSAAKVPLVGSGPIDRASAHDGKWCPQNSPNGIGFTPTSGQVTIQFLVQHRTLDGLSQMSAQLDNVSVVTRAVYDANKSFVDNCGSCFGTTFRFDTAPPAQIFFLDNFDLAPHPGWNLENGAYWETLGATKDLANPCPPTIGPVGSLGLGERPGDHRFATTWITLDGFTPGVEYVLSYFLRGRLELSHWVRIWDGGAPDPICRVEEFVAEDAGAGDDFGTQVAIAGDVAVVGAPDWDAGVLGNSGAAYVQRRENALWLPEQSLHPSELVAGALFGRAVATTGDRVAVGAPVQTTQGFGSAGAVYIFAYDAITQEWVQSQRLNPPGSEAGDLVGQSLAMTGDLLLVGANGDDDRGSNAGAVYVYRRSGGAYGFEQKLTGANSLAGDGFGAALASDGSTRVLVGAPQADPIGGASGRAYLFQFGGGAWTLLRELAPTRLAAGVQFGTALAFTAGNRIAASAPSYGVGEGSVEFFAADGQSLGETLDPPAGVGPEHFGGALAAHGLHLAVAATGDLAPTGESTGQVHIYGYAFGNWILAHSAAPADLDVGTNFGATVGLAGPLLIVGAPGDDDASGDAGSVHVEPWLDPDCDATQGSDFCDLWDGLQEDVDRNDVPDNCMPAAIPWEMASPMLATPQLSDGFGSSVALQGHRILAGAPTSGAGGAAALFTLDANSQWARTPLAPAALASGDRFGEAVALLDEVAFVSRPRALVNGSPRGRVEIFESAAAIGQISPPYSIQGEFGRSMAAVPGLLLVSAADISSGTSSRVNHATVYLVNGSSVALLQNLVPDSEQAIDNLGYIVATDGEWIALGAPRHQVGRGEVHLYRQSGQLFVYVGVVLASDGTSNDNFGAALAVGGGLLVVGAPNADGATSASLGAVYTRTLLADGSVGPESKLFSAAPFPSMDAFGSSVALAGERLAVGSIFRWERSRSSGAGELFFRDGTQWSFLESKWSLQGAVEERLGSAVALSADLCVLGGPRAAGGPGVVRAFGLGPDCNGNEVPDALDIASGHSADVDTDDIPDECTSVAAPAAAPRRLVRWQIAPNPFNPRTVIEFELSADVRRGRVTIFDANGRRVRELAQHGFPAGTHRLVWDGRDFADAAVASGSYFALLEMDGERRAAKLVLLH